MIRDILLFGSSYSGSKLATEDPSLAELEHQGQRGAEQSCLAAGRLVLGLPCTWGSGTAELWALVSFFTASAAEGACWRSSCSHHPWLTEVKVCSETCPNYGSTVRMMSNFILPS